ncbi:MAG: hypothetical protein MRERC_9c053 [Mycoplasmataceae bacterium RC_NB112A]|nr:MAG: hypothetical protein MRERC_9c053 [Mycoplasmataceae bacterium RC_NB112A]
MRIKTEIIFELCNNRLSEEQLEKINGILLRLFKLKFNIRAKL